MISIETIADDDEDDQDEERLTNLLFVPKSIRGKLRSVIDIGYKEYGGRKAYRDLLYRQNRDGHDEHMETISNVLDRIYKPLFDVIHSWFFDGKMVTTAPDCGLNYTGPSSGELNESKYRSLEKVSFIDCSAEYASNKFKEILDILAPFGVSLYLYDNGVVVKNAVVNKTLISLKIFPSISDLCYSSPIDILGNAYNGKDIFCTPLCYNNMMNRVITSNYYLSSGYNEKDLCDLSSKHLLTIYIPYSCEWDLFTYNNKESRFSTLIKWKESKEYISKEDRQRQRLVKNYKGVSTGSYHKKHFFVTDTSYNDTTYNLYNRYDYYASSTLSYENLAHRIRFKKQKPSDVKADKDIDDFDKFFA